MGKVKNRIKRSNVKSRINSWMSNNNGAPLPEDIVALAGGKEIPFKTVEELLELLEDPHVQWFERSTRSATEFLSDLTLSKEIPRDTPAKSGKKKKNRVWEKQGVLRLERPEGYGRFMWDHFKRIEKHPLSWIKIDHDRYINLDGLKSSMRSEYSKNVLSLFSELRAFNIETGEIVNLTKVV